MQKQDKTTNMMQTPMIRVQYGSRSTAFEQHYHYNDRNKPQITSDLINKTHLPADGEK